MLEEIQSRTRWAERQIEQFISMPFVSEFVFRSVKKNDRTEKEVIDFLLLNGESGVLISQKTQENPEKRNIDKNESWVRGSAVRAFRQLSGALRPATRKPSWCVHPRRGRVDFPKGLPPISHGIVIVETWQPVDLQPRASELPLRYSGVPISYLSSNDFQNLVIILGTVPDLLAYLDARLTLPLPCLRVVGDEKCLLEYYLLHGGSLTGCVSHADAKILVGVRHEEVKEVVRVNREDDYYCGVVAHVADCLAIRHADYASGLAPELLAMYDPSDSRENYKTMQGVIAGLRRWERAAIGRALLSAVGNLTKEKHGFVYRALHFDSSEWVFVLAASKGTPRVEITSRVRLLMGGAMAAYEKERCMVIIDRDSEGYEIGLSHPDVPLTPADYVVGERLFGKLRTASFAAGIAGTRPA